MVRSNYLYINARIKFWEKLLPDKTDIERMVDAPNAAEAFSVLNDTDYADNLLNVQPEEYYTALMKDLQGLKKFILKNVPDTLFVFFLFLKEDFNNIKLLVKSQKENIPPEDLPFSPAGMIDIDHLKRYILHQDSQIPLPSQIRKALEEVRDKIPTTLPTHRIDAIIDKIYFSLRLKLAKTLGNTFIIEYGKREIDFANTKSFIRAKILREDPGFLKEILIDGGTLDIRHIQMLFETEQDDDAFHYFAKIFDRDTAEKFLSLSRESLLKNIDNVFLQAFQNFFQKVKYFTDGPEIVLFYFHRKMNAIRNVRLAMIGKMTNIAPMEIKRHIILEKKK